MKRCHYVSAIALLAFVVLQIVAAGCGNGADNTGQSDLGFMNMVKQDMKEAGSFRLSGSMDMSMKMSGMGSDFPVNMSIPMEEEIEQDGESLKMKALVGVSGSMGDSLLGGGEDQFMEMYLIEDRLYYKNDGKWYYSDYGLALNPMSSNSQLVTPDSILQMLEFADSVVVVDETDSSIKYHVVVGEAYFDEALRQAMEIMPDFPFEEYESLMRSIRYELDVTVDKGSGHLTRLQISMQGDDIEFMEGMRLSMDVDGDFVFSDYGEDFNIELPEEASGAEYLDLSELNRL